MRIAGTSYTDSLVTQLNTLSAQQYQLQGQISTGQRIQKPEDDPAGMAQALSLQAQTANLQQYQQNISTLQSTASSAYNALDQIKTISDRAGEIATLADGAKTPTELHAYATELNELIQHAVKLANTKDGNNNYLFSGTKSDTPPFEATLDAEGKVTAVSYQGNTSVGQREIAENATVTVDTPGANTTGSGPRGLLVDSRYGADFFNHLISLKQDLLSGNTGAILKTDAPALTKDEDNIIYQISNNGVIQARLESAASDASTRQSSLQQSLTKVAGVDVTKAITDLSQTQNIYQAALASSSALLKLQQSVLQYL
ncbi:MAG TPA: flagellar hook-associated protein FlgL [Patescibacteria group bacterium]|jgi:flagellar hook-associated protein 3 FlgL|nr:flagellar hook-associated protein FlgL [Patescibacteria group bacterium]